MNSSQMLKRDSMYETYQSKLPMYKEAIQQAKTELEQILEEERVNYHHISYRVKSFDSLLSKAILKGLENPFEELDDILGLRVVCLFRSDIAKISKVIVNRDFPHRFEIISSHRRRYEIDRFGYLADHYVLWYEYQPQKAKIELQVRTILMDAWAALSHRLEYKKDVGLPPSLRRDFYAIAALLYAVDSQFELLRRGKERYAQRTMKRFSQGTFPDGMKANYENLRAFLKVKFPGYPAPDYEILIIVDSLERDGVDSIGKLNHILSVTEDARSDPEMYEKITNYIGIHAIGHISNALMLYDTSLCEHHIIRDWKKAFEQYERLRRKYNLSGYPDR